MHHQNRTKEPKSGAGWKGRCRSFDTVEGSKGGCWACAAVAESEGAAEFTLPKKDYKVAAGLALLEEDRRVAGEFAPPEKALRVVAGRALPEQVERETARCAPLGQNRRVATGLVPPGQVWMAIEVRERKRHEAPGVQYWGR